MVIEENKTTSLFTSIERKKEKDVDVQGVDRRAKDMVVVPVEAEVDPSRPGGTKSRSRRSLSVVTEL